MIETSGKKYSVITNLRRWVHEIELQEVFNAQCLKLKDGVRQISALDLWDCAFKHFVSIRHFSVQPITKAVPGSTRTSFALICISLTYRSYLQSVHPNFRVVYFQLAIACIHDI